MRKYIIVITIMMIFTLILGSASKEILLKIPVRVYKDGKYLKDLSKEDFTLKVNGKVRTIEKIFTDERSINDISEKRNFILQFNLTDYGKNITDGIRFFVNEVLKKKDNLIIWTPVKVYRIRTDNDKMMIISDIAKIVKEDSFKYKRSRSSEGEKLLAVLRKFNNFAGNDRDSAPNVSNIFTFLNSYSREWLSFKSKFLLPATGKYYGVFSLLSEKYPGEKYFINFQQREIIPSLKKYDQAKQKIDDYISSVAGTSESSTSSSISIALRKIDTSLLLSDNFDPKKLIAPFKSANISYNLILFHSFRQGGDESDSVSPDLEGILQNISKSTGGSNINTTDIKKGLDKILKKSDFFYYLIYKFNGKKGEKKINVEINDKDAKVFFKDKFFPEEIDLLIKLASVPKIKISKVSLEEHRLKFTISGFFLKDNGKNTGVVRVELKLLDKDRKVVMRKSNTLKTGKGPVKIALNLNADLKGFFKLEIRAKDMNVNKEADFSDYIELK